MTDPLPDSVSSVDSSPSDTGNFGLLFLAVLIDLLGFGIIIPFLPFLVQDINANQAGILLALLLSVYSLAQFVSSPLWGRLSDRIGRRPVILVGLIGSSLSFAIFGLVRSYPLFLLSRIIAGIFTGATLPTARAYIADITPPGERARRYGLLGAAFGIGFTFGPALGSLLALEIFLIPGLPEQATASLFAAFLALVNFLLAIRQLPESLSEDIRQSNRDSQYSRPKMLQSVLKLASKASIGILLVIFFVATMIFSGFETVLPLFANFVDNRITTENIGYFFAGIGILVAIVQSTVVGPVVDRFGEEGTIKLALMFQVSGFLLLGLSSSLIYLALTIIPLALGTALLNPSINSAISNRLDQDQQGGGLGINSSVGALGRVVGPLFAGFLYDNLFPGAPFIIGAVLLGMILLVAMAQLRTPASLS